MPGRRSRLGARLREALAYRLVHGFAGEVILRAVDGLTNVHGDPNRLHVPATARLGGAFVNTISGDVRVGEWTFCGHGVALLTGRHEHRLQGRARYETVPLDGRDIEIGDGVWLASRCVVLGPCTIGDDAVVCAGAVVVHDVPAGAIVAGVPARVIGHVGAADARST